MIADFNKEYTDVYKELHHKNTEKFFDELVKESKVDIEANKKLIKSLKNVEDEVRMNQKKDGKLLLLRGLLTAILIISVIVLSFAIYKRSIHMAFIALDIAIAVIFILLIIFVHKKHKIMLDKIRNNEVEITKKNKLAYEQMEPLNSLFDTNMSARLFMKTLPLISIDRFVDEKRIDLMINKYNLLNDRDNKDSSTLVCKSGHINGSPFLYTKTLNFEMGSKTYKGTTVITWTERDREGKTIVRSQTLEASITKPYPLYSTESSIYYGSEIAPKLKFTRLPSGFIYKDEKHLQKFLNKGTKKIEKIQNKSLEKDGSLTLLSDTDFEVLFNALNRNDEQQMRVLFTPSTRSYMKKLIINKENVGIGDDFIFIKDRMINEIKSSLLSGADFNDDPNRFTGNDYEEMKENFIKYNDKYFYDLYFALSPLLTIEDYQISKPQEYIYKDRYKQNFATWQHEAQVNLLHNTSIKPNNSDTEVIYKTKIIENDNKYDYIQVTGYSFHGEDMVEYVSVYGDDGYYHDVPVHWVQYNPISKTSDIEMFESSISYSRHKKYIMEDNKESVHYYNSIFTAIGKNCLGEFKKIENDDEYDKIIDNVIAKISNT